MTQRLKVEVLARRGSLIFTDPDGSQHVVRTPEEAWDLLEDLALQVQEQAETDSEVKGKAALAVAKQEPQRHRSRRAEVEARRAAERSGSDSSRGLAKVEGKGVARPAQGRSAPKPVVLEEVPPEEEDLWARGFAKVAHAVIKKSGDVSKTSRWGRGGRFSRPEGT